jgi:hypothetical protein
MKRYKMPDGTTRQYADGLAPACAVLVENKKAAKVEVKPEVKPEEKAVEPENKSAAPKKNKATNGSKKK